MRGTAALAMITIVLAAAPSLAEPTSAGALTVRITQLRSNSGQVGCMIYNSPKGFLRTRLWCPITNAASSCTFTPLPAGTYAVACFHDENKNGKLDTGLFGIPTEGTVVSNHARGFMGPPSFDKAQFAFAATATEMPLRMAIDPSRLLRPGNARRAGGYRQKTSGERRRVVYQKLLHGCGGLRRSTGPPPSRLGEHSRRDGAKVMQRAAAYTRMARGA